MNNVVLIGRLVRDPELTTIEDSGKIFTRIVLAVDRKFKNSNGERDADFIQVILWGKNAERAVQFMQKGRLVSVNGRLRTGSYENKEGERKYTAEVVADGFQLIDYKKSKEDIG